MWSKKTRASGSTAARTILTVLFLAITAWLWFNQQLVIDQIAVWRYQPSSEISQIADRSDMNDHGRFLFYASQPEVDGTQRFNQVCSRKEEGTAVLGCYNYIGFIINTQQAQHLCCNYCTTSVNQINLFRCHISITQSRWIHRYLILQAP